MCNTCEPPHIELHLYDVSEKHQHLFELVFQSDEFQNATTYREQIGIMCDQLIGTFDGITYQQVGNFFGVHKGTISKEYKRYQSFRRVNGRPRSFTDEEMEIIAAFIRHKFDLGDPPTYDEIGVFAQESFCKTVLPGTLRSIIYGMEDFKTVTGKPLEYDRLLCETERIDAYYDEVEDAVRDVPAAFLLNIDESGYQPYCDAMKTKCVVPVEYEGKHVYFGVDRGAKRSTMLAGIFGDATTLKPFIIIERATIEQELLLEGFTLDKVRIIHQEKSYITMKSFAIWADEVLFPEIQRRREVYDYNGPCILIMDGCTAHECSYFVEQCKIHNIVLIFLAPHSSDQCQMLDLVIFSAQKRFMKRVHGSDTLSKQTRQLIKILSSWQAATTPDNIISAWKCAGFIPYIRDGKLYYNVNRIYASQVRHYQHESIPTPSYMKKRINIGKKIK